MDKFVSKSEYKPTDTYTEKYGTMSSVRRKIKMLKKLLLLTPLIISVFLLSGCNLVKKAGDLYDYLTTSHESEEHKECVALCEEVIRCLDEDDKDTLKMMFSPYVRESENFDERFNELFEVYNGKHVSHSYIALPSESGSREYGEWIYKDLGYRVYDIVCDNGNKYTLHFNDCTAYPKQDHIGLHIIAIMNTSTEESAEAGLGF